MATNVKDLLKNNHPPTRPDQEMTKLHTQSSVEHNIKHFRDHGKGTCEAIEKLHVVDSAKAHQQAVKVLAEIDKVRDEVKKLVKGVCC